MNKKQLKIMWVGIAVFVVLAFSVPTKYSTGYGTYGSYRYLCTSLVSTVIVTTALIYTFKDK